MLAPPPLLALLPVPPHWELKMAGEVGPGVAVAAAAVVVVGLLLVALLLLSSWLVLVPRRMIGPKPVGASGART